MPDNNKSFNLLKQIMSVANKRAVNLIRQQYYSNTVYMQISIPIAKQRKKIALAEKRDFFIYLSLLGGFLSLVGYLAIVCHHVH
jgi:hypothetical protein